MAIYRSQHTQNYTVLLNESIRDKRLSFKARGIHHLILSYPDNWEINLKHLADQSEPDGRTAIATGLKELEKYGYIKRQKIRSEGGTFSGWENLVFEAPQENLDTEIRKPDSGRLTEFGFSEFGLSESGKPGDIINTHFNNYPSKEKIPPTPQGGDREFSDSDSKTANDQTDPLSLFGGENSAPEEEKNPTPQPPVPKSAAKPKTRRGRNADPLEVADAKTLEWVNDFCDRIFDDWRKYCFVPARGNKPCSKTDFKRSLADAVRKDGQKPEDIERGFDLWIKDCQSDIKAGRKIFGTPDPIRAASNKSAQTPAWLTYLEAAAEQQESPVNQTRQDLMALFEQFQREAAENGNQVVLEKGDGRICWHFVVNGVRDRTRPFEARTLDEYRKIWAVTRRAS